MKLYCKLVLAAVICLLHPDLITVHAQSQMTDQRDGNTRNYIEYLAGDMPLIISIPHGGYLTPEKIPERPCTNCAKNQDIYTLEIGLMIRESIFKQTGRIPYVIINHLHRTRLDPNRNIEEAASGHELAETAWTLFHKHIEDARSEVQERYGKGLFIDLHGHRHEIKRIEIGYLLSAEELQLEDDLLNHETFAGYSSIGSLARTNLTDLTFTELLRGPLSLGTMLEELGYPSVPSINSPCPKAGEPFFSGGFNTMKHGSSAGGTVDGIQLELDLELRSDINRRDKLASDLANALIRFLDTHYFNPTPDHQKSSGLNILHDLL